MTQPNIKLYKHQSDTISKCLALSPEKFAFFFEQGMGKTLTVVSLIDVLIETKSLPYFTTLIICPQIVINNWHSEVNRFSPYLSNNIIPLSHSSSKKRILALQKTSNLPNRTIIVNYESLLIRPLYDALNAISFQFLVVDECHRIKEYKSRRTRAVMSLSKSIPHRYLLSGTPILKSAQDLWSQFLVLDRGQTLLNRKQLFLSKYFIPLRKGRTPYIEFHLTINGEKQLRQDISRVCSIYRKEDALDLPPIIRKSYSFELAPRTKTVYEKLKKGFVNLAETYFNKPTVDKSIREIMYNENKVSIVNIFSEIMKMQQVASGFVKDDEGNIVKLDNNRINLLKQIIQDLRDQQVNKIIIWCTFKQDYQYISDLIKDLKLKYVFCTGNQNAKQKQEAIDSFMNDPNISIFIGNPKASGVGITLTVSDTTIFYNRGYSLEDRLQAVARNHRIGSERHKSITCIDIVCKDSIDESIINNLKGKKKISDTVLINSILKDIKNDNVARTT